LHPNNSIDFITDKTPIGTNALDLGMYAYNLCHFWSNFEIGDLNFFRSQVYLDYFQYLSDAGGFYYERWGDAPVHSIAAALFLDKNEIMHFDEIGYTHVPFFTYPEGKQALKYRRCVVPKDSDNINVSIGSCLPRWWKFGSGKKFLKEYYHEDEYVKFRDRSQEILR
jgi:mannosyltransferase